MAPPRQELAQSETKARFFERLSLDKNDSRHRRVYALMKQEAVAGRRRMTADPNAIQPDARGPTDAEPPCYSHADVSETAMHREILRIYRLAGAETRPIYDLGRDTAGIEEENWVIRWMLWHVFRYRDSRNRPRAPASRSTPSDTSLNLQTETRSDLETETPPDPDTDPQLESPSSSMSRGYWDPVRDG